MRHDKQLAQPWEESRLELDREVYGAVVAIFTNGERWASVYSWVADNTMECSMSNQYNFATRPEAVRDGLRQLLRSLERADPLGQAKNVTGVARRRLAAIREWAEEQLAKHQEPPAACGSLFGDAA